MNSDYKSYIQGLDIGALRCKTARLHSKMTSTELMTNLKHRCGDTLIDESIKEPIDVLYLYISQRKYTLCALVVLYIPWATMSLFSDILDFGNRTYVLNTLKHKASFFSLGTEYEPHEKITLSNGKVMHLFEKPYILNAATKYDKDFRKEWRNGILDYEGNQYGDTSRFYIVGCIEIR